MTNKELQIHAQETINAINTKTFTNDELKLMIKLYAQLVESLAKTLEIHENAIESVKDLL